MDELPAGATFGSLVHGVLEHADPQAADLRGELRTHVAEQLRWWSVDAPADELAEALCRCSTPRSARWPTACGSSTSRLHRPAARARLRVPARRRRPHRRGAGRRAPALTSPACCAATCRTTTRCAPTPTGSSRPSLGGQVLRGYLSGSIDVVLRVPDPRGRHRYVVVDYKTNMLGDPDAPAHRARLHARR